MIRRVTLITGFALAALASSSDQKFIVAAAEPTSPFGQPIIFRRVYAPADSIEQWPRGNVRYMMMERSEFDRLLQTVHSSSGSPPREPAYIHRAVYTASLEGDQLVGGTARLDVRHAADAVAVLPLQGCGVSLLRPRWSDTSDVEVPVGLAADGRLVALVDRSGELRFDWSLRGKRDAFDAVSFELAFPQCPAGSLIVDVPADRLLESTGGIVVSDEPVPQIDAGAGNSPVGPATNNRPLHRRWQIELGGDARLALRVKPRDSDQLNHGVVLLRQSTTFDLRPGNVDVNEEYSLDVFHEPLRELRVSMDAALRLTVARLGDADVPWSEIARPDQGTTEIILRFPQPVLGAGRTLRLAAVAPLALDSRQPLPRIVPDETYWQEGHATLNVADALELASLDLEGCRQSRFARGSVARPGEGLTIQLFGPRARIFATLSRPAPLLAVRSGTSIELGTNVVTGRMLAEFQCASGEVFRLVGVVPPDWIIESVDSDPPEVVDYWSVDALPGAGDGLWALNIRLRESLRSEQQMRLIVSGQCPGQGPDATWDVGSFRLVEFQDARAQRELIAVRPETPLQLKLRGDSELVRLEPDALSEGDATLVNAQAGDLVFDAASASRRVQVSLSREMPQYDADLQVDAVVNGGTLLETYRIQCVPESSYVDRLTVHFSQARDAPLRWSLTGEGKTALEATPVVPGGKDDADGAGGERWEIVLRRPRNSPFELTAERMTELRDVLPVSLVAVPDSASDRGTLTIRVVGAEPIDIVNHRLKSISAEPQLPEQHSTARAFLRYEASRDVTASLTPAVTVSPAGDQQDRQLVWAWKCSVDVQVAGSGSTDHIVEYRLENAGGDRVSVMLPEQAEFLSALVDGVELPRATTMSHSQLEIPLPAGKRFVRLTVHYRRDGKRLGMVQNVKAVAPQIDVPVLETAYHYWLPSQFAAGGGRGTDAALATRVVDRLFGPLARHGHQRPTDPGALFGWPSAAGDRHWMESANKTAERVVSHLDLALERAVWTSNASSTWADVLETYAKIVSGLADNAATLWIDARALDEVGIHSRSSLTFRTGGSAGRKTNELLQTSGLVLVVFPDAILLTHRLRLAHEIVDTFPSPAAAAVIASPATIDQFARARSADPANWLPVSSWVAQPAVPVIPWRSPQDSPLAALAQSGWRVFPAADVSAEGAELTVVRPASWQAAAWICFLLSLGLGWMLVRWRPAEALIATAGFVALALVVPPLIAPLLASLFLGMLVSVAMAVLLDGRGPGHLRPGFLRSGVKPAAGLAELAVPWPSLSGWLAILLWSAVAASTVADDGQDAKRSPGSSMVHRVFVPVNDRQEPDGNRVYVPEELFQALYRRDAASRAAPRGWLLRAALYRGTLDRDADRAALKVVQWTASYTIESLEQDVQVRLPLRRGEAQLVNQGGQLDGRPLEMEWSEDEAAIQFRVEEPGVHQVELQLQPIVFSQESRRGMEMSIPPLALSRLELNIPEGLSGFEVPSALGAVHADAELGRITADLGPAEHLIVSWPLHPDAESAVMDVDLEQLTWLKVRPGSVVLDAHFRCRVYQGSLRQVRLLADPRLKMLPLALDQGVADVRIQSGLVETIDLQLDEAVRDEIELEMRFQLAETSGIGNLLLPQLEAVDVRSTRRWLAVSVDPELEAHLPEESQLEELAIPEFVQAWGGTVEVPQLAFQNLPLGVQQFNLTIQPLAPRVSADQALAITCGDGILDMWYRADVEVSSGYVFQHSFDVPPKFEVSRVSALINGKQRVSRWSRAASGRLTVFFDGPALGSQQLEIRGTLPMQQSASIPLPAIRLDGAELANSRFIVARRAGVVAHLENKGELKPIEISDNVELPEGARLVDVVEAETSNIESLLVVQPSTPLVRGTQVISLLHEADAWVAELACLLEVQEGSLDVLRFDAPAQWSEELEIEEGFAYEWTGLPGQNRRRLLVQLPDRDQQQIRLRMRGPLTIQAGDRVRVPRIELLDVAQLQQFVVVPTHIQSQPIAWNALWLRESPLPDTVSGWLRRPARSASYQVFGGPFHAELRSVQQVEGVGQVQLADHRVDWRSDGSTYGVASYYLDPAGEASCRLKLPADHQLIHASVDGLVASRKQMSEQSWSLMLGPEQLPQHVEIVYTGRVKGNPPQRFESPILEGWPVRRTLWTVRGPQSAARWTGRVPGGATPLNQEMSRLLATTRMVDLASHVVAETSPDEIANWYHPWALRLATSRGQVERWIEYAGAQGRVNAAHLAAIDRDQVATALNLGTQDVHRRAWTTSDTAVDSGDLWRFAGSGEQALVHARVDGAAPKFSPEYSAGLSIEFVMRGLLAMVILGGAFLIYRSGSPAVAVVIESAQRWPHAIGVVLGLVWCMLLTPGMIGWIIVAAFLWGAFRPPSGTARTAQRGSNMMLIRVNPQKS